jgi:hypothetical protein
MKNIFIETFALLCLGMWHIVIYSLRFVVSGFIFIPLVIISIGGKDKYPDIFNTVMAKIWGVTPEEYKDSFRG